MNETNNTKQPALTGEDRKTLSVPAKEGGPDVGK